jgi:hypothetical protein
LPVHHVPATAKNAAMSISPSSPTLKIPTRSLRRPPSAARRIGETSRIVEARSATSKTASSPSISVSRP